MITQQQMQKIADALKAKGATNPCARCGRSNFEVIGAYFFNGMHDDLNNITIGGTGLPTAVTACQNCGHLAQHALISLGLMPK